MADARAVDLIHEERWLEFNNLVEANGGQVDLSGGHFRGYDLRKCRLQRADLRGAYLRSADLRSLDLSQALLEGASLKEAKVSGVLFPANIESQEIMMSLEYGTRLRISLAYPNAGSTPG